MVDVGTATAALPAVFARYRVMAYIVGVGLVVLVAIGMPLKYGAGITGVVAVVGPLHGVLYIVYLLAAFDLARTRRFGVARILLMVVAGLVPFLAFYVEHVVRQRLMREGRLDPAIR